MMVMTKMMLTMMTKTIENGKENAYDDDGDAKTHDRGEGPDATVVKGQTGEKPQPSQVENLIMVMILVIIMMTMVVMAYQYIII